MTRKPPNVKSLDLTSPSSNILIPPEKNFSIKEFVNSEVFKKLSESSSLSEASSSSLNQILGKVDDENVVKSERKAEAENTSTRIYSSDFSSSSDSSSMSSSYCSTLNYENKTKSTSILPDSNNLDNSNLKVQRFYVRSLGWVKIDEEDLTPERSSKAVNKCINDLSKGIKDINDVVARWGQGKDLYMDLHDNHLILIDPIDEKVLNNQSITSIRVWGVGRDNGR